jgi:hypothetical protein
LKLAGKWKHLSSKENLNFLVTESMSTWTWYI